MATKAIKFSNNTTTYLPVTDAKLVQMKVGNETKSVHEVILEDEEVTAAVYNELNDRLTNVETSYVKSIATSGTGTFINGVTIGNDSTGGKKLTFSYGTATSDVFVTHASATIMNVSTFEEDVENYLSLSWTEQYTDIRNAMLAGKTVFAECTFTNASNASTSLPGVINLMLSKFDTRDWTDLHFCGIVNTFSSNEEFYIEISRANDDAFDEVGGKIVKLQRKLVSGTSIKTINNTSLLGSGNISVQAPLTQHDPVTVTVSQLKYDAGQTITLNDSFVNSVLGSYTTTLLTGSSSNDYWKYTT